MSEHEFEAIRGLPGDLPEGETVLWQGAPNWVLLALDAFKLRWIIGYFAALVIWRLVKGLSEGVAAATALTTALAVLPLALLAIGIFCFLAWINSRSTVYTITSERVVMRFGAALTKAINIPFKIIESASSRVSPNGSGVVAVKLLAPNKIPLLLLWPHRKPGTIRNPEPAFRCIKDAAVCAPILAEALRLAHQQSSAGAANMSNADAASVDAQPALA